MNNDGSPEKKMNTLTSCMGTKTHQFEIVVLGQPRAHSMVRIGSDHYLVTDPRADKVTFEKVSPDGDETKNDFLTCEWVNAAGWQPFTCTCRDYKFRGSKDGSFCKHGRSLAALREMTF